VSLAEPPEQFREDDLEECHYWFGRRVALWRFIALQQFRSELDGIERLIADVDMDSVLQDVIKFPATREAGFVQVAIWSIEPPPAVSGVALTRTPLRLPISG
jgi:hypothetical protein